MRIITIHADFVEYEPLKKAIKTAEEVGKGKVRVEECLVVLTSVEEGDGDNAAAKAIREIANIAEQVKTGRIVIYPWVHLSSKPAKPEVALKQLKMIETGLRAIGKYEVSRAPFGWYKAFDIKCKGHALSELSREIKEGEVAGERERKSGVGKELVSDSLKKESKLKSEFYILTPDGQLVPVAKFDFAGYGSLKKFAEYEMKKEREYACEPPHIRLMREQKIADCEPGSDCGNMRWYPKGRLIKKLLERQISEICVKYGAHEVETPLMYDFEHPALKKYLNRFPARQYVVKSDDKEFFLRFAACFGQFLMAKDVLISYKNLPLKIYELAKSFRREQSGELCGLKRVRMLTMPDMHTICSEKDGMRQAFEEFERQFSLCYEWITDMGLEFEVGIRVLREVLEKNKEMYMRLVKKVGKPALVEVFDERYAYFVTKFEFNFIDNAAKASALSTVQIDVENAQTYGITYVDSDGGKATPVMLHASISGSIERVVYALLEREAANMQKGMKAMLPLWLSPIQVRFIPVSARHVDACSKFAESLTDVRWDIDDREETMQKKIREAEKEWIPYIVVVGDKEEQSGILSVRVRETGKTVEIGIESLKEEIWKKSAGKPFERLTMPPKMSMRIN
ncbi:MAG: threonine--tRNA ligase [Candidatus Micrarchaeia archaeon]